MNRPTIDWPAISLLSLLLALTAAGACRSEPDERGTSVEISSDQARSPEPGRPTDEAGVSLTPATDEPIEPAGEYPFRNFDLPADRGSDIALMHYPLRVENGTAFVIVVTATAGVAPVTLDTLSPGDDLRIDLEARAEEVVLQWKATEGDLSGETPIRATADSVQIVLIEARPGPR